MYQFNTQTNSCCRSLFARQRFLNVPRRFLVLLLCYVVLNFDVFVEIGIVAAVALFLRRYLWVTWKRHVGEFLASCRLWTYRSLLVKLGHQLPRLIRVKHWLYLLLYLCDFWKFLGLLLEETILRLPQVLPKRAAQSSDWARLMTRLIKRI